MEWFSPLWIPMGEVGKILNDAKNFSRERAIELFNYHTSTLYTVPFQAVCIAQILPVPFAMPAGRLRLENQMSAPSM
jgi:hypothetical protein